MAKKYQVTPPGTLEHPWLTNPDFKYKKEAGEYHTKLILGAKESSKFRKAIDAEIAESLAAAKKAAAEKKAEKTGKVKKKGAGKVKLCEDKPYVELEDGTFSFNFKMKASGESKKTGEKWTQAPALYDAKLNRLDPAEVKIGSGTEAIVSYEISQFFTEKLGAGVTLRLGGVQVLKLVEWGASADSLGFTAQDSDDDEDEDAEESDDSADESEDEEEESEESEESDDEDDEDEDF